MKGWEYFDPDLYAQRVMADAPLLQGHLQLSASRLLPAVHHLMHLRTLVSHVGVVEDLSFLHNLVQPLIGLYVSNLRSGNLAPLASCADSLESLMISTTAVIRDFRLLCAIPNLSTLNLAANALSDLDFIRNLPQLTGLHLEGLERVSEFSPLLAQRSLSSLTLEDCPALELLDVLPPLGNLHSLTLAGSSLRCGLQDIVDRAPELRSLNLEFSSWVNDITPITSLNLDSLSLWTCRMIIDFMPLSEMHQLTYLDLEDTNIGDLTPLGQLAELDTLWLRDCENVTDLAPLSSLHSLSDLHIEGVSPGVDLAPLAGNKNITVHIRPGQDVRNRELLGRRVRISQINN